MKLNKKNKLLLLGFIFMLFICYRFAISKTAYHYSEYTSKSAIISEESITPETVDQLLQKEKQLDSMLLRYRASPPSSFQNNLLEKLNHNCAVYHLKIMDFKAPHHAIAKELETNSYQFSLQGSFNGCLRVINILENSPSLGIIKHLNFAKSRDYKTNTDYLTVSVLLQKNISAQ